MPDAGSPTPAVRRTLAQGTALVWKSHVQKRRAQAPPDAFGHQPESTKRASGSWFGFSEPPQQAAQHHPGGPNLTHPVDRPS